MCSSMPLLPLPPRFRIPTRLAICKLHNSSFTAMFPGIWARICHSISSRLAMHRAPPQPAMFLKVADMNEAPPNLKLLLPLSLKTLTRRKVLELTARTLPRFECFGVFSSDSAELVERAKKSMLEYVSESVSNRQSITNPQDDRARCRGCKVKYDAALFGDFSGSASLRTASTCSSGCSRVICRGSSCAHRGQTSAHGADRRPRYHPAAESFVAEGSVEAALGKEVLQGIMDHGQPEPVSQHVKVQRHGSEWRVVWGTSELSSRCQEPEIARSSVARITLQARGFRLRRERVGSAAHLALGGCRRF